VQGIVSQRICWDQEMPHVIGVVVVVADLKLLGTVGVVATMGGGLIKNPIQHDGLLVTTIKKERTLNHRKSDCKKENETLEYYTTRQDSSHSPTDQFSNRYTSKY
jgi:hypothetical protein